MRLVTDVHRCIVRRDRKGSYQAGEEATSWDGPFPAPPVRKE